MKIYRDFRNTSEASQRYVIAALVVAVIAIAFGIYFYLQYRQATADNPQAELNQMLQDISKVILLPQEQATVVTVVDKTKLTNEILAQVAEDGDKLVIFPNANRLLVYRPSLARVIDMLIVKASEATDLGED